MAARGYLSPASICFCVDPEQASSHSSSIGGSPGLTADPAESTGYMVVWVPGSLFVLLIIVICIIGGEVFGLQGGAVCATPGCAQPKNWKAQYAVRIALAERWPMTRPHPD